jgi:sugar O-acyltransferase (sialic acid O-acetyltransferase NeuD family)
MPLARWQLSTQPSHTHYELVFIDDSAKERVINQQRVLTFREFILAPASVRFVCVAIARSSVRERLVRACQEAGVKFFSVRAAGTVIMDSVRIGEGAVLCPHVTVTSNVSIGAHFHANLYSYVEHDCVIGDFVTFAPGVKCNGNIVIEDHAYVGAGAVLKQGSPGSPLVIGRGAVVGMGAVVTKSVPAGVTVVGNPARPLSRGAN